MNNTNSGRLSNTKITNNVNVTALYKMSKDELLELCKNDVNILKICNDDEVLNRKLTSPKPVF